MDLVWEERRSDSPLVDLIWRSGSEQPGDFISIADPHWGIVITKIQGRRFVTMRGPETHATPAYTPEEAEEFIGIQFKPGALMPDFPAKMMLDRRDINLPEAGSHSFWLKGAAWEFPNFENVDTFINRLVRDELLVFDPLVAAILQGQPVGTSLRTVQRRFLQATGLTQGAMYQIKRARYAATLLKQGVSILDTVYEAGYFDQPHLTRSLKHFIGQTPAQLIDQGRLERLSFLYNTHDFLWNYDANVRLFA